MALEAEREGKSLFTHSRRTASPLPNSSVRFPMGVKTNSSNNERISFAARVSNLVGGVIAPKRVSGARAFLSWLGVILPAVLALFLLRLGFSTVTPSWHVIAFSAMFFSAGVYMLATVLPKHFSIVASCVGLVALFVSVVCVTLTSGT
jgi:hypothetical protein